MDPLGAWAPAGRETEALQAKDVVSGEGPAPQTPGGGEATDSHPPELKFTSETEDLEWTRPVRALMPGRSSLPLSDVTSRAPLSSAPPRGSLRALLDTVVQQALGRGVWAWLVADASPPSAQRQL